MPNIYKAYVAIADDNGNVVDYYRMDWTEFENPILAIQTALHQAREETWGEQNEFKPQLLHSELYGDDDKEWLITKGFACDKCGNKCKSQEECCNQTTVLKTLFTRTK